MLDCACAIQRRPASTGRKRGTAAGEDNSRPVDRGHEISAARCYRVQLISTFAVDGEQSHVKHLRMGTRLYDCIRQAGTSARARTGVEELARAVKVPGERGRAPGKRGGVRQAQGRQPALQRLPGITTVSRAGCLRARGPVLGGVNWHTPQAALLLGRSLEHPQTLSMLTCHYTQHGTLHGLVIVQRGSSCGPFTRPMCTLSWPLCCGLGLTAGRPAAQRAARAAAPAAPVRQHSSLRSAARRPAGAA